MRNYIAPGVEGELLVAASEAYCQAGGCDGLEKLMDELPDIWGHDKAQISAKLREYFAVAAFEKPMLMGALVSLAIAFLSAIDERALRATHARLPPVVDPLAVTQCPECRCVGRHAESCTLPQRFAEAMRRGRA